MIENVDFKKTTFASGYQKFEAGTPPIVQVIGLGASYDFMSQFNLQEIYKYEKELYEYAVDKLKSFILTHYEEHKDEDGKKVLDEDIEGYFTKDNCDEIFVKTKKGKKKKERQDPIEDEPMCTHCHSSDVLVNDDEDGDISQGHCNECKEDRELTICELDEEGKVK